MLHRYRYSTTPQKPFAKVSFGNQENITVQIKLYHSSSNARLRFGILPQGLQSGWFHPYIVDVTLILRAFVLRV